MIKVTIKIDGMKCGMCEAHINDIIRKNFKIKKVSSSHKKNETIIISENIINEREIEEVINYTGYKVLSITIEEYQRKKLFSFLKK